MLTRQNIPLRWVIVGAGFYPWFAAFFLQKKLLAPLARTGGQPPEIALIELPCAPPARRIHSLPSLRHFNKSVGLAEADFVRGSQAHFHLGSLHKIQCSTKNIGDPQLARRASTALMWCPGHYGFSYSGLRFHQLFEHYRALDQQAEFDDFAIGAQLARQHRFTPPSNKQGSVFAGIDYGYSLWEENYRDYLATLLSGSVSHYQGEVTGVQRSPDKGDIAAIVLNRQQVIPGDFFIDTSHGRVVKSQLAGTLQSQSEIYPSSVVKCLPKQPSKTPAHPAPAFTTARPTLFTETQISPGQLFVAGNNQLANASLHLSQDEDSGEQLDIFFDSQAWQANCVAMGPALSNRPPLICDDIHSLLRSLQGFSSFWPQQDSTTLRQLSSQWFNRLTAAEFEQIFDLDSLYMYSAFAEQGAALTAGAAQTVEQFCALGVLPPREHQILTEAQWIALLYSLGWRPPREHVLAQQLPPQPLIKQMEKIKQTIAQAAAAAPEYSQFMRTHSLLSSSGA